MPHYPPLHLPERPKERRGIAAWFSEAFTLGPSPEEADLLNQLKVREPIPAAVWGDPNRARFADELASIIAERIPWANKHFIPEDPFKTVMHVVGGEDLEYTEIFMAIEEAFGIAIADAEFEAFFEWTFGEVVDYLNPLGSEVGFETVDFRPMSLTGPSGIEARHCPNLAIFIEIRRLLRRTPHNDAVKRIAPSTNLRLLGESDRKRLNSFVDNRYGTGATPFQVFCPMGTAAQSARAILGATLVQAMMGLLVAVYVSESLVEGAICVGALASLAVLIGLPLAVLESLAVVSKRDYWRVRSRAYRRVETVAQLVEWTLERRSDLRKKLWSNDPESADFAV